MFEDILRAARKANGETFDEQSKNVSTPPKPLIYDEPKKWYEKKWGIALVLIICFPIGAILLWQNPRYSNQAKGGVTAAVIFLILFGYFNSDSAKEKPTYHRESVATRESSGVTEKTIHASAQKSCMCIVNAEDIDKFIDAAKRKDVEYIDAMLYSGKAFVVRRNTRVLCSDSGIYQGIVFVTFLEGEFTGQRAYTFAKRVR